MSAAEGALRFLHGYLGWDVWVVTRVEGDRQILLRAFPEGAVRPGTELPWAESFCRQMIHGNAPRVATVTAAVPEYASRASGSIRDIAAYVGVPLITADLELFGTLCGISFRATKLLSFVTWSRAAVAPDRSHRWRSPRQPSLSAAPLGRPAT